MILIKNISTRLASLTFCLWLLGGVSFLLAGGSFVQKEGSRINEMALFTWLTQVPLKESWWLWLSLVLLALLAVNTLFCIMESFRGKWQKGNIVKIVPPHLMHLGFLLIMGAHLLSAYSGSKQTVEVGEGSALNFPDGSIIHFTGFSAEYGTRGMATAYSATVETKTGQREIRPNHPFFHNGYGVYLKDVAPPPMKAALVEIHKEPGAAVALAGAAVFTIANIILLARRRLRSE